MDNMSDIMTLFQDADGATTANFNSRLAQANAEFATKNQPNGYAGLDAKGNLKQMPTAAQMGFENVDNTHDANKSVAYASNAGHATTADSAANTTSIAGALIVSNSEPTSTLASGVLWGVY